MKLNGKEYIKKESVNCTGCAFKDKPECEEIYGKYNCSGFILKRIIRVEKLILTTESAYEGCPDCDLDSKTYDHICNNVDCKEIIFKTRKTDTMVIERSKTSKTKLIRVRERFVDSCKGCFFYESEKVCRQPKEFIDECSRTNTIIAKTTEEIKERSKKWGSW
ncbi:MAG: hypothetical protein IBX56_20040 [Methylomicrobium sp.]|nr:hypothetical protein [Methylomicrobium sp.]